MLKNITQLEVKIAEKVYQLLCDNDSPIGHVKEALFQLTKMVAKIEEDLLATQKPPEIQEVKQPEENK
jgi:hypothetical protein